ncbi:hypothetical protein B0T16DRAFT_463143 [Cercophora newfieldiana]|uniref:Uncharacterized protein n=1 Tax=Cercophora newfieldiana TaxID=92897 RepID=A0AA40CHX1_9PEZI|nr:hypothetical protein B0T16DRAFT_463143 [Cercophora newfieldiana]
MRPLATIIAVGLSPLVSAQRGDGGGLLSIGDTDSFRSLRACALGCYNGGIRDAYMVAQKIDCRKPGVVYVPPDNDCFCRPDLRETAVRYVSTCVYTSCKNNQLDASSATQVYKDYCLGAGYTAAAPNANDAQTTAGDDPSRGGTGNKTPTETGGSSEGSSSSGGGGGLSVGAMAGIAAAVISVIIGLIGLGFKYKSYKKTKEQAAAVKAQTQGHGHGYPPPPAYQPHGYPPQQQGCPQQQQGNWKA